MAKIKFESLTRKRQRVEIAKDVIKQLDAGKLVAEKGVYVRGARGARVGGKFSGKRQVKGILPKKCNVCALGGMLCAVVNKVPITIQDIYSEFETGEKKPNEMRNITLSQEQCILSLSKYFSDDELNNIERKFEAWDNFLPEVTDPDTRLRVVMQSIVDNHGDVV